ncbi:hypothetical protein JS565_10320 [Salmonella enterica subsp. enterica serovar Senftenberg]|nr:hypothetical protein [Salmonella enterica subsp. enterica serovar Senftenberg]
MMQMLGGTGDSKQQAASKQPRKHQQSAPQHSEPPMNFDDSDIPFRSKHEDLFQMQSAEGRKGLSNKKSIQ